MGGGGGHVGMNRFYVYMDDRQSYEQYFTRWREGNTFATNGPLLLATVDDRNPSIINRISLPNGKSQLKISYFSNRPIKLLEWIADGEMIASKKISSKDWHQKGVWEVELNLKAFRWLTARCFGESERTLFSQAGRVSPPFLTAHTSPFILENFNQVSGARKESVQFFLKHIDWMQAVIEGKTQAPFATYSYWGKPLGSKEKEEIFQTLAAARKVYE